MVTYRVMRDSKDEYGSFYSFEHGGPTGVLAWNPDNPKISAMMPADAATPQLAAVMLHLSKLERWPEDKTEIIAEDLPEYAAIKIAFGFRRYATEVINGIR